MELLSPSRGDSGIENQFSTNFSGAHLENTNFDNAGLEGANFRDAQLKGSSLKGANVSRADFRGSDVTPEQLATAHCSDPYHDPPLVDDRLKPQVQKLGGIYQCSGDLGQKN